MIEELKSKMKPVMDMAEINKKTAEKLISLQSQYVNDFISSSLNQMKTLSELKDPKAAVEAQVKYLKELEAKITDVAQQEISALSEAKSQLTVLVEKSLKEVADADYVAEMQKLMKSFGK
ncbi:phasin family protein [Nitrincola tapanii]|uniref:Phasin family protein n=1 Tax=Nitrincola tapanii TaxID=1708751 RepID=A0A5A9W4J0_9GAMM|nr:phasin family protein [Nitrincola tapanii]KAA0875404.1 phasin family protein [Nitrincola tapanii]